MCQTVRDGMFQHHKDCSINCCILILRIGFLHCLQYTLRLKVGALLWSGLPCSMHVWMARGTSKKTRSNPRGWLKSMAGFMHDCVRTANCIAARFGLVALLCLVRQIWWDCEQPSSSLAEFLPYLEAALHPAMVMMGFQASVSQKLPLGCSLELPIHMGMSQNRGGPNL